LVIQGEKGSPGEKGRQGEKGQQGEKGMPGTCEAQVARLLLFATKPPSNLFKLL